MYILPKMKNNFPTACLAVLGSESPLPKKDMGRNKHGMPKISFSIGCRHPDLEKTFSWWRLWSAAALKYPSWQLINSGNTQNTQWET